MEKIVANLIGSTCAAVLGATAVLASLGCLSELRTIWHAFDLFAFGFVVALPIVIVHSAYLAATRRLATLENYVIVDAGWSFVSAAVLTGLSLALFCYAMSSV